MGHGDKTKYNGSINRNANNLKNDDVNQEKNQKLINTA